jgi:glutathione synthase/RimK-type ligase-like ATP-grasp enzyme
LIEDPDEGLKVLEVNAVPGWRRLARTLDVDVAKLVIEFTRDRVRIESQIPNATLGQKSNAPLAV